MVNNRINFNRFRLKNIFFYIFLLFLFVFLLFNKGYSGQKFEFNLKIFSDFGVPLSDVNIYDDKNSLIGKTNKDGIFNTIFYDKFPSYIVLVKDGYEKIIFQYKRRNYTNLTINLQPLKDTIKEEPFNGVFYKDKVPLSNKSIYVKSSGVLKEVWTDSQGRFSTTINRNDRIIIFYIESSNDKDSYIEDIYIEEIFPDEFRNDINYIYTSNFIKKSYFIKNIIKNPSYYFLRLSNENTYFTDIGNEFNKKNYFNNLKLNIFSKNDRIFKNYNFYLDLRLELNKKKEVSIIKLLEDESNIEYKEDFNNYITNSIDFNIGINFKKLSGFVGFSFYNIEAFEEELKKFSFFDKNGNQVLSVYFFDETFKLDENFLKNIYYYSFSIVINKPFSYDQFLDDFYFKTSKDTLWLTFFDNF